jgi:predicted nicotinamide N-methyase
LTLWRAAEHLSEFCHAHPHRFNDKTIVELGAGLGNVSILIDKLQVATMIVTTDGDDDTMELLASNLLSMKSNIVLRKLWWGEVSQFLEEFPDKFEVVLAADVIYEDEQVEPLLNTARELLRADGVFYLAYARRNISIDKVLRVAAEIGFNWDVIEDGNGQEPIYVLRISE